ncbi:MAG: DUF4349 domain-containing protein, partial [Dehalococcoidales bacterium]|nr:DUF4349 domain-containing protein [Dehalococcoidales bacterium]
VSSNTWKEGERLRGAITLRVPSGDFGNIMKSLAGMAVEVTSQSTSAKDVTEEYVDLSAKLRNLEATEQQLLKIMQQAVKIEDILNVQRELTNTRSQIEQIKARTQYLERTSTTSLININLEQSKLDVKFTADRIALNAGESVRFGLQIAGGVSPFSYDWDFGDGGKSTSVSPSHEYKAEGTYSVSVKVTDDRGNNNIQTRKDYIIVSGGWSAGNAFGGAWRGLVVFGQVLADVFIWLAIFSPVWIVGGGIWYWLRRRRKAKAQA